MAATGIIKINFKGGIISPGHLYNILVAARRSGILDARIGLRQQLLFDVPAEEIKNFTEELSRLGTAFEINKEDFPNIVSSYPAEEIFITNTWLSEGVYKDIFDLVDYQPGLKINVSDCNQSFTPMLTGNINWVASPTAQHFWHLFIRFPRTNVVYEWKDMVYTNDVARMSKEIESVISDNPARFIDNENASGDELYAMVPAKNYNTKPGQDKLDLPGFNLPYYEGLNRYQDKSWLGIYRRDELFSIEFLKELCSLCLHTKVGQVCSTPWKSIIVKGIEERDRDKWSRLLEKYEVNMRHAANELNFQVEDNSAKALEIKNHLIRALNRNDTRTFGLCIGIKTRRKSEIFSSILVRRRPMFRIFGLGIFYSYDILCARDFNPNERTARIFSMYNPKFLLAEQLRRSVLSYYEHRAQLNRQRERIIPPVKTKMGKPAEQWVHQCIHCLTVYDMNPVVNGLPLPAFENLPEDYQCPLCEAPRSDFRKIGKHELGLQPV